MLAVLDLDEDVLDFLLDEGLVTALVEGIRPLRAAFFSQSDGHSACRRGDPSLEGFGFLNGIQVGDQGQESLLQHLLGVRGAQSGMACQVEHQSPMTVEKSLPGLLVSRTTPFQQVPIHVRLILHGRGS